MSLLVFVALAINCVIGWEGRWFGANDEKLAASCHMTDSYPPPSNRTLPTFIINLDADAKDRWTEVTTTYKKEIQDVIEMTIAATFMYPFRKMVNDVGVDSLLARLPNDWGDEIVSIAQILEMSKTNVFLYNLAYALMGFCTSIVAQDEQGNVYHGRNLDFGLWPDVNWTDVQWDLTTDLKKVLFVANFTKGGEVLYQSVAYGGFIGLHTGIRKGAMTLTIDTRFDDNMDKYLEAWIKTPDDDNQLLVMTTRYVMETYDDYGKAFDYLKGVPMVCPSYIILGGLNKGEGVILTYGPNMTLFDDWGYPNGMQLPVNNSAQPPFYVLETNYDHWEQPPWFDDRRYPAEDCMDEIGSKAIDLPTLYNVLDAIPNRNRLTTFTALMHGATGHLEAYKQYCTEKDCIPW